MGVDFYNCEVCGEIFADCGEYVSCDGCGAHWCSKECAEKAGGKGGDYAWSTDSCKLCRNEDADDADLFKFILQKYRVTREEVLAEYLQQQEEKAHLASKEVEK
jgi:hypothetical protein